MVERLAEVAHDVWAHWMQYLFSVSTENHDGSITIPADKVKRWKRQMKTSYRDLTEREKRSDRNQAVKYLAAVRDEINELLSSTGTH